MHDLEREREYIRLASEEPDLTPEEEYEFYKIAALRTKADLLIAIREKQRSLRESDPIPRSEEFYQRLDRLFNTFCEEIESHIIMEPLDNFWGYAFEVTESGITLNLEHFMLLYDFAGDDCPEGRKYDLAHYLTDDDRFPILETRAKLLSLEEYGKAYDVGAGTVRQWIRRGKLRSVSKFGNEWRVSELADRQGRQYQDAAYRWKVDLPDPPAEVPEINKWDSLNIIKNSHKGEWVAQLECFNKKEAEREIVLNSKEKEKLELYLLSHPLIECWNNYIFGICQKKGSEYKMMKRNPRLESIREEISNYLEEESQIKENHSQEGIE